MDFKVGQWARCRTDGFGQFTVGKWYLITAVHYKPSGWNRISVAADNSGAPNGWGTENFDAVVNLTKLEKAIYGIP